MSLNAFPEWKWKLIELLAGKEPVVLNMTMFPANVLPGVSVVYLLPDGEKLTVEEASNKGVLVPTRNIIK